MPPTWFRKPGDGQPGTLNPCYDALDRPVVVGRADEVALTGARGEVTLARLLEQVAGLAGGLRAVGVRPGRQVAVTLADGYEQTLATLAALRLGAVTGDVDRPDLQVTDRAVPGSAPTRVLRGVDPVDPERDLTWDVVMAAGRQDPAPCAEIDADAPAYVVAGREVTAEQAATDDSPIGRLLRDLAEGRAVEL